MKEEAKERQSEFKGNQYIKVESTPKGVNTKKGETSKELAKLAEVGSGTMARYEYVKIWKKVPQILSTLPLHRLQMEGRFLKKSNFTNL